jgi:MFS family permease
VAHWLRDRGFDAYAVRGGVEALRGESVAAAFAEEARDLRTTAGRRGGPLGALRHRHFRRYSAGVLFSLIGNWIEGAAFGYVVLLLGGSAATLALIGFLTSLPNLVLGLPAGALADRYDPRKLLLVFQGINVGLASALAALWVTDSLTVPLLAAVAVVGGSIGTLSFPPFQGMLAATVPPEELESAVAVNSLSLQLARFIGPAIAGVLLASVGPAGVFAANAASFLAVLAALALMPRSRSLAAVGVSKLGGAMKDGLRYVFGQRSIASLMGLMIVAGVFATPPVAYMLPAIVRFQLHGGPGTLGLLFSLMGLGSVVGSLVLLALSRRPNKGEPALAGFFLTAIAIAAIGVSHSIGLSFLLAFVGGLSGVVFIGLSTVVVQSMSSDEMRARAMAIWAAAFVGMLPFGALLTAGLTAWVGPGRAVLLDGLATLVGGLAIVALRPEVRWLGCAALPEACIAATSPAAVALEVSERARAPSTSW